MLDIRGVSVRHGSLTVLDDVGFSLQPGQWLMVAGPNGAGKSTLVRAIAQGIPYEGDICLYGKNVKRMRPDAFAREVGVLSQSHSVNYGFTVEEVVNLGRYAYRKDRFSFSDEQGEQKVREALQMTGMLPLRHQSVLTLSGGELQRAFLAQVFAQDPNLLVLDEPANHLDLAYQKEVFELIETWVQRPNRAAISVVHDIGLARAYGTHAMLLRQGKLIAYGKNREALSPENLQAVYSMDVRGWMQKMLSHWGERVCSGETHGGF